MTLRFVKTAILSSSDGIDFGSEVAVESEEVLKTRAAAEAAANKPLYQQLADLRDLKQLEYDENTKKIFAPPKGLDEEDIEFFEELDTAKELAERDIRRKDDNELEAFRESRRLEMLKEPANTSNAVFKLPPKKIDQGIKVGITVKAKRKISDSSAGNDSDSRKKASSSESASTKTTTCQGGAKDSKEEVGVVKEQQTSTKNIVINTSNTTTATCTTAATTTTTSSSSLFGEYDSD